MIKLTEAAVKHLKKSLPEANETAGVLLGLKKVGCSGYAYTVDPINLLQMETVPYPVSLTRQDGVLVAIKTEDWDLLNDVQIDYQRKGFQTVMIVTNPREKAKCGCGESVSL